MTASTVAQYVAALPADRRAALSAVRKAINENLPDGYEEGMQFGMIGWYVPLSVYPAGGVAAAFQPFSFQCFSVSEEHMANYQAARALMGKGRNAGAGEAGPSRLRPVQFSRDSGPDFWG